MGVTTTHACTAEGIIKGIFRKKSHDRLRRAAACA